MAAGIRSRTQTQPQAPTQTRIFSNSRRGSLETSDKPDIAMTILKELRDFKVQIRQELKDTREEIRLDVHKEIGELSKKIDGMSKDVVELRTEVEEVVVRTKELDRKTERLAKDRETDKQNILIQEIRYRDRSVKIRGLPEKENENLIIQLLPELASYLDIPDETLDLQFEKAFRINSTFAKERNLPRDIVLCFTNSRIREKLCQLNYEERLVIDGKELEVFRDLPANILKKRQEYRFLTQLLQKLNIRYRWERIEGISLTYGQKRYRINSIEKAKDIYKKLIARKKKEEEKEDKEKEKKKDDKSSAELVFEETSYTQGIKGDKDLDVQEVSLIDLDPAVQDISRDSNSDELY
ncbi:uncharacterized protein PF11_0207-like [Sceloporus undulatus]|uniref:uncharacterized protein PF11_0207-like n=1 Tax=Sceloporus undulatus TaxID=8520 RepID=UPI001C4D29E5|nr:uncharacterized protein PF11_0207-like [Sceloporus undulatus]